MDRNSIPDGIDCQITTGRTARATRTADCGIVIGIGTYRFPITVRALNSVLNLFNYGGDVQVVDTTCGVVGVVGRRGDAVQIAVPEIGLFYGDRKKFWRWLTGNEARSPCGAPTATGGGERDRRSYPLL
jgi:hypothetical protein